MAWKLIDQHGNPVVTGIRVKSARGDTYRLDRWQAPRRKGGEGLVFVSRRSMGKEQKYEFAASVFGFMVVELEQANVE